MVYKHKGPNFKWCRGCRRPINSVYSYCRECRAAMQKRIKANIRAEKANIRAEKALKKKVKYIDIFFERMKKKR